MLEVCKRKISVLSTLLFICLFANSTQAAMIFMEDFEGNVAPGWVLNGTSVENEMLVIDTLSPKRIATSPIFDLTAKSFLSISFDFDKPIDPSPQATRWVDLELWNGSAWAFIDRIKQNAASGSYFYEFTAGFTQNGQFRFVGKGDSGGNRLVLIDNVEVNAVPAPHALAIFGFGLLLLAARWRTK
jgi:hypothetical protein